MSDLDRREFLKVAAGLSVVIADAAYSGQKRSGGGSRKPRSSVLQASRQHGGHMQKHVGRSRSYLHKRTHSTNAIKVFNAATHGIVKSGNGKGVLYRRPNAKALAHLQTALGKNVQAQKAVKNRLKALKRKEARPIRASSFHSTKVMDRVYQTSSRRDRARIASWLRDPKAKSTMKLPFKEKVPVGHLYARNSKRKKGVYRATNGGHFVLKRTADGKGYYPLTSMLY